MFVTSTQNILFNMNTTGTGLILAQFSSNIFDAITSVTLLHIRCNRNGLGLVNITYYLAWRPDMEKMVILERMPDIKSFWNPSFADSRLAKVRYEKYHTIWSISCSYYWVLLISNCNNYASAKWVYGHSCHT